MTADLDLRGARVVGVTGGTSTPIEDLQDVAQRVLELFGTDDARRRCRRARGRGPGFGSDAGRPDDLAAEPARETWTGAEPDHRRGLRPRAGQWPR